MPRPRPLCDGADLRRDREGRARGAARPSCAAPGARAAPARLTAGVPLVLVQCKSFFDARRLSPLVPAGPAAGVRCVLRETAATFGRLEVAGWGANTMRAEFAVLTGIPGKRARLRPVQPLPRLCARADRLARLAPAQPRLSHGLPAPVRPQLFPPRSDLAGARVRDLSRHREPRRFAPAALLLRPGTGADHVLRVLDAEGPSVFIFAITMGNHGPWREAGPPIDPELRRNFDTAGLPQGGELLRYLDGLRRSDEMLQILLSGLQATPRRGGARVLRRPPAEPAPRLPSFRLRRSGQRLCRVAGRRPPILASSICRPTGCRASLSMRCARRGRSTGAGSPALVSAY